MDKQKHNTNLDGVANREADDDIDDKDPPWGHQGKVGESFVPLIWLLERHNSHSWGSMTVFSPIWKSTLLDLLLAFFVKVEVAMEGFLIMVEESIIGLMVLGAPQGLEGFLVVDLSKTMEGVVSNIEVESNRLSFIMELLKIGISERSYGLVLPRTVASLSSSSSNVDSMSDMTELSLGSKS